MTKYKLSGFKEGVPTLRMWVQVGKKHIPISVKVETDGDAKANMNEALDKLHEKHHSVDTMFRRAARLPGDES